MSRSQLNQTLDKLYAAESIDIPFGKPIDAVVINRKTLTQYPLSPEDIEIAGAGAIHHKTECEVCNIINKEA